MQSVALGNRSNRTDDFTIVQSNPHRPLIHASLNLIFVDDGSGKTAISI